MPAYIVDLRLLEGRVRRAIGPFARCHKGYDDRTLIRSGRISLLMGTGKVVKGNRFGQYVFFPVYLTS